MSRVRLGNITTSIATELVDFYVAGIINSESGFLVPKMVTDQGDVDLFFGDFPYADMYKGLINKRIPSVMLPIITPVSKYNRASIRINKNNSYIAHCHPRYGKSYKYVSYGDITIKQFGTGNKVQEVEVATKSKFHLPYNLVMYDDTTEEVGVAASYRFDDNGFSVITLRFSKPISGEVTVESYPSLESDRKFSSDPSHPDKILASTDSHVPSYRFDCINNIIPDIVVVDPDGNSVEYYAQIKENTSDGYQNYVCEVYLVEDGDTEYYIHYRMTPKEYSSVKSLTSEVTQLNHQLRRYPKLKFQHEEYDPELTISPYDCSVIYSDKDNCIISVSGLDESGPFKVIFNVLMMSDTIDYTKVEIGEVVYSTELDFSGLTNEILISSNRTMYFTLLVNNQRLLFVRVDESNPRVNIPIDYFDEIIYLNDDNDHPIKDVTKLINKIKIELEDKLGIENVDSFSEECIESINNAFSIVNPDLYHDDQEDWKDQIEDQLYAYELYLGSYRILVDAFKSIYNEYENFTSADELKSALITIINTTEEFHKQKLMVNYYVASKDLNYYDFDGLRIREVFNSSQDVLCSLTETDKIIEFYSKIKGSKGENTVIKIDKVKNYDHCYDLTITNGNKSEYFKCYTYKTGLTPSDAIDIRIASDQSELVEIKLYDYELDNGVMIDQMDLLDYMSNDEYNPNNVILQELPLGTFQLKRITHEDPIYEDYQSTLMLLSESGFYPDLLLVPEFFTEDFRQQLADIYSLIRGQEVTGSSFGSYTGCVPTGLYSQALVTIKYEQLKGSNLDANYLPDNRNRMLYFFDDMSIKGARYPSFYPYIDHIINSKVLKIPSEELIFDPDSIKVGNLIDYKGLIYKITDVSDDGASIRTTWSEKEEQDRSPEDTANPEVEYSELNDRIQVTEVRPITGILDEIGVNYLLYNNLYYYYTQLSENIYQPSQFIIQFNCSKISRAFMDWGRNLKSLPPNTYSALIGNILSRLRNCLPYIESIVCNTELNGRYLTISTNTTMKGMMNKVFTLNYHLNIT